MIPDPGLTRYMVRCLDLPRGALVGLLADELGQLRLELYRRNAPDVRAAAILPAGQARRFLDALEWTAHQLRGRAPCQINVGPIPTGGLAPLGLRLEAFPGADWGMIGVFQASGPGGMRWVATASITAEGLDAIAAAARDALHLAAPGPGATSDN